MKKTILLILIIMFLQSTFAQVGIGTDNPQKDLDVNGSMLVQKDFNIGQLPTVNNRDENFKLLTRITNTNPRGEISVVNVDSLTVAPINIVNYKFINIKRDNLTEVNLQYNAAKYIVALSNFQYIGNPIKKVSRDDKKSIGAFVYRVFVKNGTWHMEARNRFLHLPDNKSVEYRATLIIYDKSYFRHLPIITTDLLGENSGSASATPNF